MRRKSFTFIRIQLLLSFNSFFPLFVIHYSFFTMKHSFSPLVSFLFFLIFSVSPVLSSPEDEPPLVWFVHGMRLGHTDFQDECNLLRKIFPNAEEVVLKAWKGPSGPGTSPEDYYLKSRLLAEEYCRDLLTEIEALPIVKRERLILVGHSLGGRIVVRTLAAGYRKERLQVRQMILAGAAIDFNDVDLFDAVLASRLTAYSLVNPSDLMLAAYKIAEKQTALGTGTLFPMKPEEYYELTLENSVNHYACDYLNRLWTCIQNDDFSNPLIIVPQDFPIPKVRTVPSLDLTWSTVSSKFEWKLQRNQVSNHYRILNEKNVLMAEGRQMYMIPSFERVCQQFRQKRMAKKATSMMIFPGQKPVSNPCTLGSNGFWCDVQSHEGWRLQRNLCVPRFRIVDSENLCCLYGEKNEAWKFFRETLVGK